MEAADLVDFDDSTLIGRPNRSAAKRVLTISLSVAAEHGGVSVSSAAEAHGGCGGLIRAYRRIY